LPDEEQTTEWYWWQRMFSLPFSSTFTKGGEQNLTIPHLRENTTYDVLCWGVDAVGNDISQELVGLPLPWAETRIEAPTNYFDYGGAARRLQADAKSDGLISSLSCTGPIQEFIPCQEKILTSDKIPPSVLLASLANVESTANGYLSGETEVATWQVKLGDASCIGRKLKTNVECILRCEVHEASDTLTKWQLDSSYCDPRSVRCHQKVWFNEQTVSMDFILLRPGIDYTLRCDFADPWGNVHRQQYDMPIPAHESSGKSGSSAGSSQDVTRAPTALMPVFNEKPILTTTRAAAAAAAWYAPAIAEKTGDSGNLPSATTMAPPNWDALELINGRSPSQSTSYPQSASQVPQ
ncbi:unnamed protein product, partial [Polarella glacialis]